MKGQTPLGAMLLALIVGGPAAGGEPGCCEPPQQRFVHRLAPVGGWDPYGGGLLRWWDAHCFPRGGTPDDYCRKQLPRSCWPPYPCWYTWGTPENGCPVSAKSH
jgi:hypothetical protein